MLALPIWGQGVAYAQALQHFYQADFVQAKLDLDRVDVAQAPYKPVLQSLIFLAEHEPVRARVALERAKIEPQYSDYYQYIEFLINLEDKDLTKGQEQLENQWNYENVFLLHKSQVDYAQALYEHGQFERAGVLCHSILNYAHDPVISPQAMRILLMMDLEARNREAVFLDYGQMVSEFSSSDPMGQLWHNILVVLKVQADVSDCFLTPKAHFGYLKTLYADKNYEALIKQVGYFFRKFDQDPLRSEVYFYQGLGFMGLHQYYQAKRSFDYAAALDLHSANYVRDRAYAAQAGINTQDLSAVLSLKFIVDQNPRSPYAPWACYELGTYYLHHGDYVLQKKYQKFLETNYHASQFWPQYVWDRGYQDLHTQIVKKKSSDEVVLFFNNLVRNSVVAARLMGFYRHEVGGLEAGILQYPVSYFAVERLTDSLDGEDPFPEDLQRLKTRMDHLHQMGLGVLAGQEVMYVSALEPETTKGLHLRYLYGALLAKLRGALQEDYAKLPDFDGDPLVFVQEHMPRFFLKLFYPRPYWDKVQLYARLYHVDPYLVLAVMREESTFDAEAVSRTQAKGLMQISVQTGRDIAFRLGMRWTGDALLFDPEVNIRLGTFYLSWLKRQLPGPNFYALAAYNAGPETASSWIQKGRTNDLDVFSERIPYTETRVYIRRVLNSYLMYKVLYEPK